jgi:hypothetical protein
MQRQKAKLFTEKVTPVMPPPQNKREGLLPNEPGFLNEVDCYDEGILWKRFNEARLSAAAYSRGWPRWYS